MLMKSRESREKVGLLSTWPRRFGSGRLLLGVRFASESDLRRSTTKAFASRRQTPNIQLRGNQRVKGIEPSCAAWEAAVLPLNYTRGQIFDFRFSIADCNRNQTAIIARKSRHLSS